MQRLGTATVVLLFTLIAACAAVAASASPPRAQLTDPVCQTAHDPPARAISVTAVMRPLPGTQKLEMEIQLLSRAPGSAAFAPVSVPAQSKLGSYITPTNPPTLGQRPGDIWKVQLPVADLAAPAVYHFQVVFRWLGTGGVLLGTTERTSPDCRQTEHRADLTVPSFTVAALAGHPKLDRYTAVIANRGASAARRFEVRFVDAGKTVTDTIAKLAPHSRQTLKFTGPVCAPGAPPTLTLDPQHVIDDVNATNLTATASCPAAAAPSPGGRDPGR